jgi:hypothetical protein
MTDHAAKARLFRKRERLIRLTQCYLATGEHGAIARVAIDVHLRSLDREICRLEHQVLFAAADEIGQFEGRSASPRL